MDGQLTTALVPKYRKGHRYDLENSKTSAPVNNSDFYHNSKKQLKGRISTYDKIVQELSKDENNSIGKSMLSILGGGDTNVLNPSTSTSPGRNTNVGGTLTLYPSGGVHFHNFKPSFSVDLPQMPSQMSPETKGISNRGSPPSTQSQPQLLDFVEKFNKQEDEYLSPDDFLDYRDSQAVELTTESDGEMVIQDDLVNNNASNYESRIPIDNKYHCIDNQSPHNKSFEDKLQLFPNTLAELFSPLPTISSPSEISSLKEEIEGTAIFNSPETPVLTFNEKVSNIAISSVAENQGAFDLISRVRSFSGSSIGRAMESTISSPSEISSLKEEIEGTAIFNSPETPVLTFNEKVSNIAISSVAENQGAFDLISRVRSFSGSSIGRAMESSNIKNIEHNVSVSSESSISNVVTWKSDDTISLATPKNSTSNFPLPPTRERKLSESLLGFFTGIFGNSPTQSISERSEQIKEVAEISMLFRY